MKHITEASDKPVALKSWEVTDSAWSAFSAEEHMTNGVQAAYNAGMEDAINAANPTSQPAEGVAELLARTFHEAYERLAPSFGYETRKESAVDWDDVPEPNRSLMLAVAAEVAVVAIGGTK